MSTQHLYYFIKTSGGIFYKFYFETRMLNCKTIKKYFGKNLDKMQITLFLRENEKNIKPWILVIKYLY